ncbi:hypothetical protein LEMLEM_LOCUS9479, partial [Lemmus lemmus]
MGPWSQGTLSEMDRREQEGLDLPIFTGKIKLDWWLPSQSRSRWASFDQW